MFGKLRDKLKGFFGKKEEEKPKEKKSKTAKSKKEKPKKLPSDKKLKKEAEKLEEAPVKFEVGELKYEPDVDEIIKEEKAQIAEKKGFLKKIFGKKVEEEIIEKLKKAKDEVEEEAEEVVEKPKENFISKLFAKMKSATITQEHVDEIFSQLEIILLENNVALDVVDKIKENLSKDLVGTEVDRVKLEKIIMQSLKDAISSVLIEPPDLIEAIKSKTGVYTIIFFGINGTGKTTSIAKLAYKLKKENISCVLAAADTFRAAAIQQLETHAERLGVPIIKHDYNADPTAVAFDAKKYAETHKIKCVLIDTAGRMYTKENLIKQMEKIIRVIKPDLKIFVGEATTGNDAIEQVKTFNEAVGIDGIILSKADVDEKGGTALSVSYVTGKPIYFLGVGQDYDDLEVFKKETIVDNLGLD